MDFNLTKEEEAFRDEVRTFIKENLSKEARKDPNFLANWLKKVREKRWVGFNWPAEYGGGGGGIMEQVILKEEMAYYRAPLGTVEIGPGTNVLQFDLGDSGSLLLDVRSEGAAYDQRFVAKIVDDSGSHFYAVSDAPPYWIPSMAPGTYRITELQAHGRECVSLLGQEIEVFPGQMSALLVECGPAGAR